MARTILGQQQVQGVDYAYTLQGWLKGVNSMALDTARDMGKDGGLTARDAYGYQLNYFTGDYLPINASRNPFPGHSAHIGAAYRPLYNGNISSMAVNIGKLNQPQLYNYEYDQLNRLVSMQAWRGFTSSTNSWTGMTATADHQESITYDGNGNILTYLRNGNTSASKPLGMDNLSYFYNDSAGIRRNNRLRHVTDAVAAANYTEDIDGQAVDNYGYDAIGNLTRDNAEKISAITWNVYGKISQITKTASTVVGDLQLIRYGYDASGNRIRKTAYYNQDATNYRAAHTWYVRDASGNVMATYTSAGLMPKNSTRDTTSKVPLYLSELHMYGSSRLGIWSRNVNMDVLPTGGGTVALLGSAGIDTFNRGNKFFELSNHLGNVLVTVSDRKLGQNPVNNLYTSFTADVVSATDYAPFGMQMVGRTISAGAYRYGFNGKENDKETSGDGNQYDYGFRIYNPRLGRFLSVDPLADSYPYYSTYQFAGNKPTWCIDLDGLEEALPQLPKKTSLIQNSSESTCIGCVNRAMAAKAQEVGQHFEKLKKEYQAWRSRPENFGKPIPPQFEKVVSTKYNNATVGEGGYMASAEFKIAKERYDLYGKYLPGVSDIDDGLTVVKNIKDKNYKSAAFSTLFFFPGGDFLKPLKNLKGAGKFGGTACMDFAGAFMSKYGKKIEDAGGSVRKMEINMGEGLIGAGLGAESKQLSNNGLHQFIEVTDKSGAVKIFDNAHPEGIMKADYLKTLAGSNKNDGFMEGKDLYDKYAKQKN